MESNFLFYTLKLQKNLYIKFKKEYETNFLKSGS